MRKMRIRFVVGCLVTLIAASDVMAADCITDSHGMVVCGKGQCAPDQYGKVFCAQEGGGAVKNRYGTVMCGVGYCAKDDLGDIHCARKPGGGATTDSYGKVKCLGGCQSGAPQRCEVARPGSN